jgi:two-component sensor histidine kinase
LGLELIHILAEDQLEGKVELDRTNGTKYNILLKRQT